MIGQCSIEGCENTNVVYSSGYCNAHYQRWKLYGRFETVVWGQSSHPLYNMWNERKNAKLLCEEWIDFKSFLKGVGDRPEGDFRMGRKDKTKVFGPDNFHWKEYVKRLDGETKNQHLSRRRYEQLDRYKSKELMKNYNLSLEDYNSMIWKQENKCQICKEPEVVVHHVSGRLKSLAVDHNHETGKVRGLLCQRCNRVLGKVRDSVELLDKMKDYLNAYS